jgi:hypothetical protein
MFELKSALETLYERKPASMWTYEEERNLVEVARRPDWKAELAEIERWKPRAARYFPKLLNLLAGWPGHLDRARIPDADTNGKGERGEIQEKIEIPLI